MLARSEEIVTGLEMKISYLAIIGTLGPMIGLVGTVWGMIMSFQEIATAAGAQPRPEKVAEGISTALFITLEGVTLSVPAIFFFAFFRNRIAQMTMEANKSRIGPSIRWSPRPRPASRPEPARPSGRGDAMSATIGTELQGRAQPHAAARRRLPVDHVLHAGDQLQPPRTTTSGCICRSPNRRGRSRTSQRVSEDRLVLNVDKEGTYWSAARCSRCT